MSKSLSIQEAQKLVLQSQNILTSNEKGSALDKTLSTIEHLGYIQIDTISTVQRAHHHTLWNRNQQYQNNHLDELVAQKKVFEYWSHAAAYLPMQDFKYTLPRKDAISKGEQKHWFERDDALMKTVLKRIETEGPLMAKDFVQTEKIGAWGSKPAKQALVNLFMQGELMISSRKNFHKVYDLTERVLPKGIDINKPTQEEYIRFLIKSYLRANGIGQATEITYLLKKTKVLVSNGLKDMHLNGELVIIEVNNQSYFALPEFECLLNIPLLSSQLKILSPFDNLLIQRKRMQMLFDFDYQIECYVPMEKRKYGYFSLPILWTGKLVARMDCKAEKTTAVLHINHLALEKELLDLETFTIDFCEEINNFMQFNNSTVICIHKTTPDSFKTVLEDYLHKL
ncbi:winged helix-turn-helix domain-containing protein [Formosa sp. PL04]|uniref:winged helix-turn-helix domain-containing protein n=1 Tax=Formosa sp. PL04 TaxID=3081755 RepID=UPI0029818CB7|nr:crosslink repair DNA glycosylase YcaQ family protein [Formosa sp. PL04]MDW5290708.1 crosslink repair DNA glycosylase YcaQ family protein [Formosa sp. PL04]